MTTLRQGWKASLDVLGFVQTDFWAAVIALVLPLAALVVAAAVVVVLVNVVAGLTSRGRALRPLPTGSPENVVVAPAGDVPLYQRWSIESNAALGPVHSCSFVEFDERGDYLDFPQHRQAYLKIQELAATGEPLTLVIYVHGWRHNGQSHDVLAFNECLHQLANPDDGSKPRRVHGVYLTWRGASLKSWIGKTEARARVGTYFGGPIIDPASEATFGRLNYVLESLGYFSRKSVPEHKFAGTALARTVFSCGYAARRNSKEPQILLMGHSFGALMLERAFQNAAIGQLTDKWPFSNEPDPNVEVNPLPFDSVVLVNSAAPSIYAKQFQSYLAGHRQAMARARSKHAKTPFMFSLTSEADWATGKAHQVANLVTLLVPTLWRRYRGDDFILVEAEPRDALPNSLPIRQSFYYRRTPGHNPLLVNRFVEPASENTSKSEPIFITRDSSGHASQWRIAFPPVTDEFRNFSCFKSHRPLVWTERNGKYPFKDTGIGSSAVRKPSSAATTTSGRRQRWTPTPRCTGLRCRRRAGSEKEAPH